MILATAESEICAALERMSFKPENSRPFVVVTAKANSRERFVQFYGSRERGVNLDLPFGQFDENGPFVAWLPALERTDHGYALAGCSPKQGAVMAIGILRTLFFDDADIEIEEHADGTGVA
jgi:hypothetical protein